MWPRSWPGWRKVSVRPMRFTGVLLTLLLIGLAAFYYRGNSEGEIVSEPRSTARGGQIIGTVRGEPRSFNRFVVRDQTVDTITMLTQGRLVRINRATFEL